MVENRLAPSGVSDDVAAQLEGIGIRRGRYSIEPLSRMQKLIVARLSNAARDIPSFPMSMDVTVDRLLARRAAFNSSRGTHVSISDLVIRASALALKETPSVNSSYTAFGVVYHKHADVAVAVATDHGLITPIVSAAEEKSLEQISVEFRALTDRARARQLREDEYFGGTFTISNLGMHGISSFGSIINPPHSAILSIGTVRTSVMVNASGAVHTAPTLSVTLTCDHRVIDGVSGARWLNAFRSIVQQSDSLFD